VNGAEPLRICADLANGTKHLALTSSRTTDLATGFTSQSVTVRPGPVGSSGPHGGARPPSHSWVATSNGQPYDAVTLGVQVIAAWDDWLRQRGLLT
jgi:hypothetical protein